MTQEQLQAMTDAQLNEQVALKVFGGKILPSGTPDFDLVLDAHDSRIPLFTKSDAGLMWRWNHNYTAELFSPATSISDAWQVVEKMQSRDLLFTLNGNCGQYLCEFHKRDIDTLTLASSAPRAICIAAMLAMTQRESR